jgi:hypothetical protein
MDNHSDDVDKLVALPHVNSVGAFGWLRGLRVLLLALDCQGQTRRYHLFLVIGFLQLKNVVVQVLDALEQRLILADGAFFLGVRVPQLYALAVESIIQVIRVGRQAYELSLLPFSLH